MRTISPPPERPAARSLSRLLHHAEVLHLARIDRALDNLHNVATIARRSKPRTADFRRDLVDPSQ